jgi:hypothetical protein
MTIAARYLMLLLPLAALSACSGGDTVSSATTGTGTGLFELGLTDAPVDDAAEVVIVFDGIEVKPLQGDEIIFNLAPARRINLLQYRDGETFNLLEQTRLRAEEYEWIRLRIRAQENLQDGSYIRLRDGRQFPLFIPSGAETGLKLQRRFRVAEGGITRLLIDFDLRKSLVMPPGQAPNWILRPSMRLMDRLRTGTLEGEINLSELAARFDLPRSACDAGLYLFAGADQNPDDMDGDPTDGADTVVYLPLDPMREQTRATYRIHYLETGPYTLALTCRFGVDADPSVSEDGQGFVTQNITVS